MGLFPRITWERKPKPLPQRAAMPVRAKQGKKALARPAPNGHHSSEDLEDTEELSLVPKLDKSISVLMGDDLPLKRHTDLPGYAVVLFAYFEMMAEAATLTGGADDIDLMEVFERGFEERMLSQDRQSIRDMKEVLIAQLVQESQSAEGFLN